MSLYATYDPVTGEILRSGQCQESDIELQAGDGQSVIERENPDHHDSNAYVMEGVITERPAMPATIDILTISDVPEGVVLTIEGTDYTITDGTAELSFTLPGTYQVKLALWPYVDAQFEVTAV
jgi:hypothetical protein